MAHSLGWNRSSSLPIRLLQPETIRSAALRSMALRRKYAFSIGLKSGLKGGRNVRLVPAASIRSRTTLRVWLDRLSILTMSPCRSSGTRNLSDVSFEPVAIYRSVEHHGASMPLNLRPGTGVVVVRWPGGHPIRSRSPVTKRQ